MRKRRLIRSMTDSNNIWGDLSNHERLDSRRFFRRSLSRWVFAVVAVVFVLLLAGVGYILFRLIVAQPNVPDVVAKVTKSVVAVYCGDYMGTGVVMNVTRPDQVGSVIISAAHIFDECNEGDDVGVEYEGAFFEGKLVAKDPDQSEPMVNPDVRVDLARIDVAKVIPGLDAAPSARVGDWAIVVGNPLDRTNYASFGIVSSVATSYYETTASVNEGNSGGPMVDSWGRVLGIVSSYELKPGLYPGNPEGILDQAAGMSQIMRLNRACNGLFSNVSNCPFTD
jgi:S1-C subfamily serine protease